MFTKLQLLGVITFVTCSSYMVAGNGSSRPQVRPQDHALIEAIKANSLGEAQRLIDEEDANINTPGAPLLPIHWVAIKGTDEMVAFVLQQKGVDIHARSGEIAEMGVNNAQAIHLAAIRKNEIAFKALLESGAELYSECTIIDNSGRIFTVEETCTPLNIIDKYLEKGNESPALEMKELLMDVRNVRARAAVLRRSD